MTLTGPQMERLVELIGPVIERPTLTRVVRYRLETSIEDIVKDAQTKIDAVFQVLDWSARRGPKVVALIEGVAKEYPNIANELRKIVEEAQSAEIIVTPAAAPAAPADPLAPYFPYDVPFIDREDLTQRLDTLWSPGPHGVLVVRGERYTGRSYSWLRISNAASAAGVTTCKVDLSRDPGSWTIAGFIDRVAALLRVDRARLKDSLAQGATQSGALVSALVDRAGKLPPNERWCMVFDGLDRPGIEPAIIELVEDIIDEVLAYNIPFLSVIVLGYGEHPKQSSRPLILTEKIRWLGEGDLTLWLDCVARAAGKVPSPNDLSTSVATILEGRVPPFDAETMEMLRDRVKSETVALLKRLS